MWCAIVADEIYSEQSVRLWSASSADNGRDSVFQICALLSCMLKIGESALASLAAITKLRSLGCTAVKTIECASRTVEDGGSLESLYGLYMNQSLSQPPKCIHFTPHEAPELAKLQPASSGGAT